MADMLEITRAAHAALGPLIGNTQASMLLAASNGAVTFATRRAAINVATKPPRDEDIDMIVGALRAAWDDWVTFLHGPELVPPMAAYFDGMASQASDTLHQVVQIIRAAQAEPKH